jgi:hypothetical protein
LGSSVSSDKNFVDNLNYLQSPYDGNIPAAYVPWNYHVVKDGSGATTEKYPVGVACTTNGT